MLISEVAVVVCGSCLGFNCGKQFQKQFEEAQDQEHHDTRPFAMDGSATWASESGPGMGQVAIAATATAALSAAQLKFRRFDGFEDHPRASPGLRAQASPRAP